LFSLIVQFNWMLTFFGFQLSRLFLFVVKWSIAAGLMMLLSLIHKWIEYYFSP
jgi:hypothetical protein